MLNKIITGLLILLIGVLGYMLAKPQGPNEAIGLKLIYQGEHENSYNTFDCSFVCQVINYGSDNLYFNRDLALNAEFRNIETNQIYENIGLTRNHVKLALGETYEQTLSYNNLPSGRYIIVITSSTLSGTRASFTKTVEIK